MSLAFVFPGHRIVASWHDDRLESLPQCTWTLRRPAPSARTPWSVSNGPDEKPNKTVNTQPAMLTAGVALFRAWRELGVPSQPPGGPQLG
jgi:[acyl-carrier-protein] S-malonyltransferase